MEMWGDSLLLEFQNKIGTYSIYLSNANFSNKRIVPPGFKTTSVNMIEKYDNIIYFRPDFRESIVNPLIYSYKQDFNNCEGLIVDLRGNSGGDLSFLTFFSLLISEKNPIMHYESNLFKANSNFIIKPSNIIQIQVPIVIIVDARTTCMSELLINALRKSRPDVYIIGVSSTAGSAQRAITTILPNNAMLTHFDGITKDAFGNMIDDNIGIVPDSLFCFESYKDLFPYEDSLKHEALKYLGYPMDIIGGVTNIINREYQY
jgi:C-terminal processing protease CtpA/Prc